MIESIKDKPFGWEIVSLKEILPLNYGKSLIQNKRNNSGKINVYGSSGVIGKHDTELTKRETLIVGRKGNVGSVHYSSKGCWPIDTVYFTEPHKELSPLFWYYYLSHLNLCQLDQSTAIPGLSRDRYSEVKVFLPPKNEQSRIISKIEELFSDLDKGEENLRLVQKLIERYRQSVLKAAVTGELTREWREKNKDKLESGEELLERILKARRKAWEEAELAKIRAKGQEPKDDTWKMKYKEPKGPDTSGLPKLPEGWVWATPIQIEAPVPNALTIGPFGSNLKVSDYKESGVPLVFVKNIRSKIFFDKSTKYISRSKATELQSHSVRPGDLLITKMGDPPGDACIYPINSKKAVVTADCIKWTISPLIYDAVFYEYVVNSCLGSQQITKITKGVAQQKVSLARFRNIAVPIPPLDEQKEIVNLLANKFLAFSHLQQNLYSLFQDIMAQRQAILKAAFSGQLVPQDPNDEPASELLKRIVAEKVEAALLKPTKKSSGRKKRVKSESLQKQVSKKEGDFSGNGLAKARKAAGLTQSELAKKLGINQAYISQLENGRRVVPEEQAGKLSEILGTNIYRVKN